MKNEEIKKAVRESYGKIAVQGSSCCGSANSCCCGNTQETISKVIGYSDDELGTIPDDADLGLGCGNPAALASLKQGELVLDLGSGAGIDCFLAANKVGDSGRVIGVDMTHEMLERARENTRKSGYNNVEFRLGEIENLPVADNSVDVVISNCVINLSPEKGRVFKEAYRVLKSGGRVMISDIVLLKELPETVKNSIAAYVGCIAGATTKPEYLASIEAAGFEQVEILSEISARGMYDEIAAKEVVQNLGLSPEVVEEAADSIVSIAVCAVKPV